MNKLSGKQISILLMSIFIVIIAGVSIFFAVYMAKLPKNCQGTYYLQYSGGYLAFDPSTKAVTVTPNQKADGLVTKWNFSCSNMMQTGILMGWFTAGGYQIAIGSTFNGGIQSNDLTEGTLFMLIPVQNQPDSYYLTRISQAVYVSGTNVNLSASNATPFKFVLAD